MTIDSAALPALFEAAVPFAGFLGVQYDDVAPGRAVLRLADDPAKHNHLGTSPSRRRVSASSRPSRDRLARGYWFSLA